MTSSPQFMIKKKLGSYLQCQPNIFVLQALLKKLHRGALFCLFYYTWVQ